MLTTNTGKDWQKVNEFFISDSKRRKATGNTIHGKRVPCLLFLLNSTLIPRNRRTAAKIFLDRAFFS